MKSAADKIKKNCRQMEVLRRLAKGETRKQIADGLKLSMGTVNTYCDRLYNRLDAKNPVQAFANFIKQKHPELKF